MAIPGIYKYSILFVFVSVDEFERRVLRPLLRNIPLPQHSLHFFMSCIVRLLDAKVKCVLQYIGTMVLNETLKDGIE